MKALMYRAVDGRGGVAATSSRRLQCSVRSKNALRSRVWP